MKKQRRDNRPLAQSGREAIRKATRSHQLQSEVIGCNHLLEAVVMCKGLRRGRLSGGHRLGASAARAQLGASDGALAHLLGRLLADLCHPLRDKKATRMRRDDKA